MINSEPVVIWAKTFSGLFFENLLEGIEYHNTVPPPGTNGSEQKYVHNWGNIEAYIFFFRYLFLQFQVDNGFLLSCLIDISFRKVERSSLKPKTSSIL